MNLEALLLSIGRLLLRIVPVPDRKYKHFFENMDMPFMIVNNDGLILRANHALLKRLGYRKHEFENHRFLRFVHPMDIHDTIEAFETLRNGGNVHGFVNRYYHKDGTTRAMTWHSSSNGCVYAVAVAIEK